MPFDPALNWLHAEVIHASVAQGVHTRRADDSAQPGPVVQQILDDIDAADVIFAVCTGKNANVFFELGYAWGHHTPILIAEDTHDLPFDLLGNRTALYGRKSPGADRHTLRFRLEKAIASVLAEGGLPRGRRLAARFEQDALASVRWESSDAAAIVNDASRERIVNQSSDPVAVAEARVAEKWQDFYQLNSRRIEAGADVEGEIQQVFQDALDITTEIFGDVGNRVTSEVKAGGQRERIGRRALPHIEDAMAAMEAAVAACNRHCDMHEGMDKIDAVFAPLHRAHNCLAARSPSS